MIARPPRTRIWEKKPLVLASTPRALGDPILFTDHGYPGNVGTGRTFVSQEEGQVGSTTDVTDNDGDTFQPSVGAGPPAGIDHQTIAAGPYHQPVPPSSLYPRAVYYASQSVSDARTSRSDDGGITFGPAVPMYTTVDCGGLHGHIKVAPDGTVYVPNNACGGTDPIGHADGQQAAIVSEDNGLTWSIRPIPGSDTKSDRDPSIGIATDGTVYMGMQAADGHARISVTHNKGVTWSAPFDVGAQLGIQNSVFPAVVAGDPNRAAFAFYGTTTGGNNYDQPEFPGVWYLYVATTFDGGVTWNTQNVTPGDPIQRGGICGDDHLPQPARFLRRHRGQRRPRPHRLGRRLHRRLRERREQFLHRQSDHLAPDRRQAHVRRLRSSGASRARRSRHHRQHQRHQHRNPTLLAGAR